MDYLGQRNDVILGQDFLTWLWYKSEAMAGMFRLADGHEFELRMEQRVSVQGGEGESLETATVSGAMSELNEARLGLATGKKVTKAQLRIEQDGETWQVTVKAEDMTLHALRTPAVEAGREEDDDPDAAFLEKMFLVEKCVRFVDTVYEQFLRLRLGPEWTEEVAAVRVWLEKER
ncbi:MAG: hypothetical protein H0S85_14200 [Desulfovibrionaceae bacterium]|jgi:hypothetical protein|nr:hypothetical protein [Desulfovibrionaceae bacterium]